MNYKLLGERVRKARGELSLREFAKKCDISHTHLDSIEKGIDPRTGKPVTVSVETLEKIAAGAGCSIAYLLGNSIGDRIKNRRLMLGMTIEELANQAGEDSETMAKYETGEIKNYTPDRVNHIAIALKTTSSYLLGYTNEPDAKSEVWTLRLPDGRTVLTTEAPEIEAIEQAREVAGKALVAAVEPICSVRMLTQSGAEISILKQERVDIIVDFIKRNSDLLKAQIDTKEKK